MAINPTGAVPAPLSVFGSWVTEVSPDSVPENISPDCADVVFAPGLVGSRPALQRALGSPFPAGGPHNYIPTVTYQKSFKTPTGSIKNLYLDSNGVLYVEDLTNSPGTYTVLLQTTPGSYMRSCTAFGREYLAPSDGLHGSDIPYQYDGTNLDRVTQDGPATPPMVSSLPLPAVTMATTGAGVAQTISSITASNAVTQWRGTTLGFVTFYTAFTVTLAIGSTVPIAGAQVTIAGTTNAVFNQAWGVATSSGLTFTVTFYSATLVTATGGTATATGGLTLQRQGNFVTAATATAHRLQVGYQAQISGMDSLTVGSSVTSIVIDNDTLPGIATFTMSSAHDLLPQNQVSITNVSPATIGAAGGWTGARNGDTVTLTIGAGTHDLKPGVNVKVTDAAADNFTGSFTIAIVPSPTQIVYYQAAADATAITVTVALAWPIPDTTLTPTFFEVISAPTPTTFQVQVFYADGTWTTGTVAFPWNGKFFVASIPSPTSFTYQQYGPNGTSTTAGTVTPFGQCAPGLHVCQVLFLTRQGAITKPSPPTTFVASGGQYVNVTNIPTGPDNVVARILAFSGAQPEIGGIQPPMFYIPVQANVGGVVVSTSTEVNDNITASALFDFSDNTLFASIGISIPGNNLANQIVLDGALGFGQFLSRLTTWGQRNVVQNMLNMTFSASADGLNVSANPPAGWQWTGPMGVLQKASAYKAPGISFAFTGGGTLYQSIYQDASGVPIALPNTKYKVRAYLYGYNLAINATLTFTLATVVGSFSTSVTLTAAQIPVGTVTGGGGWIEVAFPSPTPGTILPDMQFEITSANVTFAQCINIQECKLIYQAAPYLDCSAFGSYVNNPEGMDGDTGQFGPEDPAKLMDMGILRGTLCLLTQAPSGRLHETDGSGTTEPSGWLVNEVAANCGTLSAFGLTHSQADDEAASGGDEWIAWPSEGGVELYGGGQPAKVSQEIQPNWYDPSRSNTAIQINMAAAFAIWGLNDPVQRLLMFGVPIGAATAPSKVYVLNYRNLGSAQAIEGSPPFHPSLGGKLIATDNSRKWAPWNMKINTASRMYRQAGVLSLVLGGGNGQTPGAAAGFGNVYTLNPAKLTDDDYGQISAFYTTYFFMDQEKAIQLGLKGSRILMAYVLAYIQGTGQVTATYFRDDLANPWSLTTTRTLTSPFYSDRNFGGGMCTGDKIAIKIASSPITGTDNGFAMSRLTAFIKDAKLLVSGTNQ